MQVIKQTSQLFSPRAALPLLALTLAILLVAAPAFATTFTFEQSIGSLGNGPGELAGAADVAIRSSDGRVYVADAENRRIQYFSASGVHLGGWDASAGDSGAFTTPVGIAINQSTGNVYVVDDDTERPMVQYFSADGTYLGHWDGSETADGQFDTLWGIDIDQSTGNVYIVDPNGQGIHYFSPSGALLGSWGVEGCIPLGIAISPTSGRVYVTEVNNSGRVQYFSKTGDYQGEWTDSSRLRLSYSLSVHPNTGDVYVADFLSGKVLQYSDPDSGAVTPITGDEFGTEGADDRIAGLDISAYNSRIYVADVFNGRIQVFTSDPVTPAAEPVSVPAASWWSLGLIALAGGAVVALGRRRSRARA